MKQVLHIFRKDLRHHWPEGVLAVLLMVGFVWQELRDVHSGQLQSRYAIAEGGSYFFYHYLLESVVVLVPVVWFVLIVRVVQSEPLVGNRQFWVTRPYDWKALLVAKAIFISVFVNVPMLIADVYLLAETGFRPLSYLVGLLWMQFLIVLVVVLPGMTLAAITASLWQFALAVLAIVLYFVGMGMLSNQIPSSSFSSPTADSLQEILLVIVCAGVVLLQYSRRHTVRSRWMLGGLAILVAIVLVGTPYERVVTNQYPRLAAQQQSPVEFAVAPSENVNSSDEVQEQDKEIPIILPLSVSGIGADSIVVMSGVKVAIEGIDGSKWTSGWRGAGNYLFEQTQSTLVSFSLPRNFYERVRSSPAAVRVSAALTTYHDENERHFVTPEGWFLLDDVGHCIAPGGYSRAIECLAALRTPSSLLLTADLSLTTCPALGVPGDETRAEIGAIAHDWELRSGREPAEFGISPLHSFSLYPHGESRSSKRILSGICPGTPLILSNPRKVGRTRMEMTFWNVRLPEYRVRDQFATGFGVVLR